MPIRRCPACTLRKRKPEFDACEWNKTDDRGNCKTCMAYRVKTGAPFECNACNQWFGPEAFHPQQRSHRSTHTRMCCTCKFEKPCDHCKEWKTLPFFTKWEWEHASDGQRRCKACTERSPVGQWYCKGCQTRKPQSDFSDWMQCYAATKQNYGKSRQSHTRCNTCKAQHEAEQAHMRRANQAMVVPSQLQPSLHLDTQTHVGSHPIPQQSHVETRELVNIFCPTCATPRDMDIDKFNNFWSESPGKHRFDNVRCLSVYCKKQVRVGRWLRCPDNHDSTIEAWLRHNNAMKPSPARPSHLTKELYMKESTGHDASGKRPAPDGASAATAKRTKR